MQGKYNTGGNLGYQQTYPNNAMYNNAGSSSGAGRGGKRTGGPPQNQNAYPGQMDQAAGAGMQQQSSQLQRQAVLGQRPLENLQAILNAMCKLEGQTLKNAQPIQQNILSQRKQMAFQILEAMDSGELSVQNVEGFQTAARIALDKCKTTRHAEWLDELRNDFLLDRDRLELVASGQEQFPW